MPKRKSQLTRAGHSLKGYNMKLITTENGMKKLVPENGMFLTNGETIAEGEVWLGKLDSESNWHEVTPEE